MWECVSDTLVFFFQKLHKRFVLRSFPMENRWQWWILMGGWNKCFKRAEWVSLRPSRMIKWAIIYLASGGNKQYSVRVIARCQEKSHVSCANGFTCEIVVENLCLVINTHYFKYIFSNVTGLQEVISSGEQAFFVPRINLFFNYTSYI